MGTRNMEIFGLRGLCFYFTFAALLIQGNASSDVKYGKCLEGHVLRTIVGISMDVCVSECALRRSCFSVNYARRYYLCELNNFPSASELDSLNAISTCVGYAFRDVRYVSHDVITPTGQCENNTCEDATRCVENQTIFTCTYFECDANLSVSSGIIHGNTNAIGRFRKLECTDNTILVGNESIECLDDGQWSVTGTCETVCDWLITNASLIRAEIHSPSGIDIITHYDTNSHGPLQILTGSTIEFSCPDGERLEGDNITYCVEGVWSNVPLCVPDVVSTCGDQWMSYSYTTGGCVESCNTFADTFQTIPGRKLNFLDESTHHGLTHEGCMALCLKMNNCASCEIDNGGMCNLSTQGANDGGFFRDAESFTFFQRDCVT